MRKFAVVAAVLIAAAGAAGGADVPANWSQPEPVRIEGYAGDAMEPFLSRDGATLFFNTLNDPKVDTDIHFATRRDDLTFVHRGVLEGTRSAQLDGVPTMSRDGLFCFISPRDYATTLSTVFCGRFTGSDVVEVTPQLGLKTSRRGRLIFDVELSADGQQMIFAEGTFSGGSVPDETDLFLAERGANGFVRSSDGARILKAVNTEGQEYAPALSGDGLELFFTRLTGSWFWRTVQIYRAVRPSVTAPFGPAEHLPLDGFVEGPTLSADGHSLYFHKLIDGRFGIWRVKR